jgi:methylated-DNA-[protein]-cysteine S-methyltransferase
MCMQLQTAEVSSPIGIIRLALREGRLCALAFSDGWPKRQRALERRFGVVEWRPAEHDEVSSRLQHYFAGELDALAGIAVDGGGTPFQVRVWAALRAVPVGRTVSYGDLARAIGSPTAVRAVGAANGANPIGIVVPCHRVIGADGRLVGYGGGLERKRWLLRHEGVAC